MSLADRIKGKTDFEIIIMDLGDVSHTLNKYAAMRNESQVDYSLVVLQDCIKRLKEHNVS
jgi:hypothetical protein